MQAFDLDTVVRADTASEVNSLIRAHMCDMHSRAPELDRLGAFPTADVAALAEYGALRVFASDGAHPLALMEGLRLLGRANLSLGRIIEGHVNGALLVRLYGSEAQRASMADDLATGKLFGVWNTESPPGVKIICNGKQWLLCGSKSYATGAGHVQRAIVTATDPHGDRVMVLVDGSQAERADPTAWAVSGMRASCSGRYDLTGMEIDGSQIIGAPGDYGREPHFSAGAWRFTAVQLGGAERILQLFREHLTGHECDPVHVARFGEALADVRSGYLWVREAAMRAHAIDAGADEVAFVLMTRGVVERAGLSILQAATRTVGTKAFFSNYPLDQACRDLALYLRQPAPDQALQRSASAFIERDAWRNDPLW